MNILDYNFDVDGNKNMFEWEKKDLWIFAFIK